MKKLSLLIALCMLVSIGGVYAVWTYAGANVSSVDRTLNHGLTAANSDTAAGTFAFVNNNIDIAIDPTEEGGYIAGLVITGSVEVKFTPSAGASDNVKNNAVPAEAVIYLTDSATNMYGGKEIYVVKDEPIALTWTSNGDGTFTATITADQIKSILSLNGEFVLDTLAKYDAFHDVEEHVVISIKIQQSSGTQSSAA